MALIGVGAAFLPHFALGCAIAAGVLTINLIMAAVVSAFVKSKKKKEYLEMLNNKQLLVTLGAPILEELIIFIVDRTSISTGAHITFFKYRYFNCCCHRYIHNCCSIWSRACT